MFSDSKHSNSIKAVDMKAVEKPASSLELTKEEKVNFYSELVKKPKNSNDIEWLAQVENKLLLYLDYISGVDSKIVFDKKEFPTGVALVRTAPYSLDIKNSAAPDSPELVTINSVLRTLNTLRSIHFMLKCNNSETINQLADDLTKDFIEFLQNIAENKEIVLDINDKLITVLHITQLDQGINSEDDYTNLLNHYRDLTSLLTPAKSMVTITKEKKVIDQKQTYETTIIEAAHPITVKTEEQKKQLNEVCPNDAKTSLFNSKNQEAIKIATQLFQPLILKDDRRTPAQTRNTIGPGVKNGYIVHNKIIFHGDKKESVDKSAETWSFRCGSLAPVRTAAINHQKTVEYTQENMRQIQLAISTIRYKNAKKPDDCKLYINALVSAISPRQKQSTIISRTKEAKDNLNKRFQKNNKNQKIIYWTNIGLNIEGFVSRHEISSLVTMMAKEKNIRIPTSATNRSGRLYKSAFMSNLVAEDNNVTRGAFCASGQDRTGSEQEAVIELWLAFQYFHNMTLFKQEANMTYENKLELVRKKIIEPLRVLGFHNAMLASLATPGSTGMKFESNTSFFTDKLVPYLYRKTANTNKLNPARMGYTFLKNFKIKQNDLEFLFEIQRMEISRAKDEESALMAFSTWLITAIDYQRGKKNKTSYSASLFGKKSGLSTAQTLELRENIYNLLVFILITHPLDFNSIKDEIVRIENGIRAIFKNKFEDKKMGIVFNQLKELITILEPKCSSDNKPIHGI